VRPSWHEKKIPRELDDLVLRLLAKDPDERPSAAGDVAEALAEIARIEADRSSSVHDSRSEETLPPATLGLFVGRDRELGQLQEIFTRVLAGEGSLAMVVGEPGIGKTRLTKEFSVHARLRGAEVFLGPCYEGEGWVPYQPFVEALRLYVRAHPDDAELRAELGEGAPELATLVPEIRERVPDIPDALPLEGEDERKRLFESMSRFLQRAAETKPLVLVLDDLHWADKPTLLLLLHLARHIRHDRVLLLGTYRDVELERTHPLAETVAKLRSDGLYERVLLRGLTLEGVRDLLSAKSGDEVPIGFVEPILRETEGNPFFVEEVIKHLIEVGAVRREGDQWVADQGVIERSLPEGVREVIGHRLSRLSEPCNSMLTVASAMTGGFSFDVLTRVCDEGEEALLDRLDEALRAQVIRDRGDAGEAIYEFSHALIRQTLYQELSTPRRVRLHRQIGEALEQLYGLDSELYAAELAHHFFQGAPGGDVDKAIETSIRAAERARRLMAWDEAASHGARAVEAFEMKGDRDPARHFELLFGLGEAERLAGERSQARTTLARAAEIARQLGDAETFARAILSFAGEDVTVPFDTPDVLELLEEALERIDGGDSELRLRLLSRLAIGLIFDTDPERRNEKLSREAVAMARRIGEPRWLCRALIIDDIISPLNSDLEVELERSREKLELAEQAGNSELVLNARISHIMNTMHTGDTEGLERQIAEYGRLAAELRQPAMYWFAATQRALLATLRGPLDEAQARIEEAREAGERGELPLGEFFYTIQSFVLEIEQAPPGAATEAALAFWDTRIGKLVSVGGSACSTHLRLGDIARAREVFEATARRHFADIPLDNNWIGRMYSTAAAGVQLADAERAPELYDLLLPFADFMGVAGPVSLCYGPVHQILGRLAFLMGRAEVGVRHFEASLEKTERLGFGVLLARFRFQFGECLVARGAPGDHTRARSLISDALTAAESLGMKVLVEEALALKLRLQGAERSGVKQSVYLVADAVEAQQPDIGAHAAPDGTVTLLFSDMAGFTAMTERLGDLRAREVVRVHNRTVRDQLEAHGGYEVELQGDGFLLAFGSARQALLCAIAIQRALADYNREHREEPISVRIGVHTGEALKDADKFFGRTVILAARIADQAEGGEILVSSIVRELTANAGDIRFGSEREVALKGISASQRLMRVEWPVG
jgi:class 3 adenylate cyclase